MLLKDKLSEFSLILASHSPRRRQLLDACGLTYTLADDYNIIESYPADMPKGKVAEFLSNLKSDSYPQPLQSGDILLTADTTVLCRGEILGKPADNSSAVMMLKMLSGAKHTVVSGVTLRGLGRRESFSVATDVWFRPMSDEEICYYVDNFSPLDKAGAYGIQEWIGYAAIERIEGSFYNVMGLPIQVLYCRLERYVNESINKKNE